jgi:hypothetical protein
MVIATIGFYLTGQDQEGTPCKGDDENAEYERDDEGDCVYKGCKIGYAVNEDGICVFDQSGKDCEGSDPNAIYETNVSNVCSFVMCNYGYNIGEDGNCVIPEEGGDPAADSATDSAPVPGNCVGEWKLGSNQCNYECGPPQQGQYVYEVKTSADPGGAACPHATGDTEMRDCENPECPTVDTTETINGVEYEVKYIDPRSGDPAYYAWYGTTLSGHLAGGSLWGGIGQTAQLWGADDDPIRSWDGHGYLRGDKMGTSGKTHYYVVKRSKTPVSNPGTCVIDQAFQYSMKMQGYDDYECEGRCAGKGSEGTCEDNGNRCDYSKTGRSSSYTGNRRSSSLLGACKWLEEGETQEIAPRWESEWEFLGPKKVDGAFLKTVDGQDQQDPHPAVLGMFDANPGYDVSESRLRTADICSGACFDDPECTGFNTIFPSGGEGNKCELFTGDLDFSGSGSAWTGARGYKIVRRYE